MTEQVQTPAGAEPVPEQVVTATPEAEVEQPVVTDEAPKSERTFTQAELDAEFGKRLARAQRKWERDSAARVQPPEQRLPVEIPPADSFESTEAYAEALATRKAEELVAKRERDRQSAEIDSAYYEREEESRDKYSDFDQVVRNPNLRITEVMAEAIKSSDIGPDLAYWLGSNPKEALRISQLSATLQAKEIGRLEAKVAAAPPAKKTTSAPEPIKPVTSRSSSSGVIDTTDPRSTKTMTTSEWIEAERQRQIRNAKNRT